MPSVTNVNGASSVGGVSGNGHSAGGRCVRTNTGTPSGWRPPHACVLSNSPRPTTSAPALFQISRRCSALASDVLNTHRPPTVGNSTSPLKYQSKSGPTSPDGSAMNPSSDIAPPALTVPMAPCSLPGLRRRPGSDDVLGQLVHVLLEAVRGAVLADRALAVGRRREQRPDRDPRLPTLIGELDRREEVVRIARVAVEVRDALGLTNIEEDDRVRIVGAVRSMHRVTPGPARTHVHLVDRRGEAPRSPPLGDVRGIRPHLPDRLARGVQQPGRDDLAL